MERLRARTASLLQLSAMAAACSTEPALSPAPIPTDHPDLASCPWFRADLPLAFADWIELGRLGMPDSRGVHASDLVFAIASRDRVELQKMIGPASIDSRGICVWSDGGLGETGVPDDWQPAIENEINPPVADTWLVPCAVVQYVEPVTLHGSADDQAVTWIFFERSRIRQNVRWPMGYSARFAPALEVYNTSRKRVAVDSERVVGGCPVAPDGVMIDLARR